MRLQFTMHFLSQTSIKSQVGMLMPCGGGGGRGPLVFVHQKHGRWQASLASGLTLTALSTLAEPR